MNRIFFGVLVYVAVWLIQWVSLDECVWVCVCLYIQIHNTSSSNFKGFSVTQSLGFVSFCCIAGGRVIFKTISYKFLSAYRRVHIEHGALCLYVYIGHNFFNLCPTFWQHILGFRKTFEFRIFNLPEKIDSMIFAMHIRSLSALGHAMKKQNVYKYRNQCFKVHFLYIWPSCGFFSFG